MAILDDVKKSLAKVKYPGYSRDVLSFGIVKDIRYEGGAVRFRLHFTTQSPEVRKQVEEEARAAASSVPGVKKVEVELSQEAKAETKKEIPGVANTIAVTSGKGGVGKSTVSVNLALALHLLGSRVGILDADIYGPNIPIMMGIDQTSMAASQDKLIPVDRYGIKVMSIGFFIGETTPVIWRGPMVMQMVKQFLLGVDWGLLDFLVVDLPPGTGDAQLTLVQTVPISGAVVVTTPQDVALLDAKKAVKMFEKVKAPVLGIIENMSYFLCPHCHERTEIFSYGGGKETSRLLGVPFLGEIPIDIKIRAGGDKGEPIVMAEPESAQAELFKKIAGHIAGRLGQTGKVLSA